MEFESHTEARNRNGNHSDVYVHDSSVDYKGGIPIRSCTGSWRASLFIILIEFSERLCYFGISSNLITYLTGVMHLDLETSAKTVNNWAGVTTVMPLLGGFLADAFTGRFFMVLFSSILYVVALTLLAMTQFIPILKPCPTSTTPTLCLHPTKTHQATFFTAAYLISLTTGGHKPCLESFGADQFDDDDTTEHRLRMSYFNWWNISLCCGLFLGVTAIVYMEDNVGWGVAFLVLAMTMGLSVVVFFLGRPFYRYRVPQGSPFTSMVQVLLAAFAKRKLQCLSNPALLHEVPKSEVCRGQLLSHTNRLSFLDKAAIVEGKTSPWRLATVTRVEEVKLLLSMIPIWLTSLVFGIGIAQATTFFIKQASSMDRRILGHFEIPPASMYSLTGLLMLATVATYDRVMLPVMRRVTGDERGISILKRIGVGMIFLIIAMIAAAVVEKRRLQASQHGIMINAFWLAPQFIIIGIGDGFSLVGLQEFFYDQVPNAMRSVGMAFYLSVIGVGSFASSLLIIIVNRVTEMKGGKGWIGKDLNHSKLDKFYWLLAIITMVNMSIFVVLARNYSYKNVQKKVNDLGDSITTDEELAA